jgi:signal transduction histidine kinase
MLTNNPAMGLSLLSSLSARLRVADQALRTSTHHQTQLSRQLVELQSEKQKLLEMEQLRQDTIDLIVHDLRHPISSLYGAIKIMEMVLPADILETNRQLLQIANANCDHLQLMVDSLLDVARLEAGESHLNFDKVNVGPLIDEVIERTAIISHIENITIVTDFPADLPPVVADVEKIDRVLANLIYNAIKYTPSGEQITVDAQLENQQLLISVTDRGGGIPPEEREHIFGRFTRLGGEHGRGGGYGLGLAFCRLAVEAHGGQIWVESGPDEIGSRFVFTLPLEP